MTPDVSSAFDKCPPARARFIRWRPIARGATLPMREALPILRGEGAMHVPRYGADVMIKAIWNGAVIAESADTVIIEGNHYFPPSSVKPEFLKPSQTTTECGWKGTARYHSLMVDGNQNTDAAWYYANPKNAANAIRGHIAFWKGVTVG
jgi:uncharacterized protein (DUF427 family)